ncbi:MAG: SUMF1/EgtB/PvdO family nonheme iron enzyme [Verrucomicrobiota bacterium]|jgi:formylglycine-generating enzyme required for sulfatase activity|nr:SUMF1/EgtB/PvdO family nonheme iron enzyme [Verrucomicrobiota bacterium]
MNQILLMIVAMALVGCASTTNTPDQPFINTLGMKFVSVKGTDVQYCIWETRVRDYAAYAAANAVVDGSWKKPEYLGERLMQTDTHPVVMVSWNDAQAFCAWLTKKEMAEGKIKAGQRYRLPTDEEWSVAVSLGKEKGNTPEEKDQGIKDVYPWGKEWPPTKGGGNYSKIWKVDEFDYTSPVGSFAANALGLYDMGGNVWEWCEDWYDPAYKKSRVSRGASWAPFSRRVKLLSSDRFRNAPVRRSIIIGFRCVLADE